MAKILSSREEPTDIETLQELVFIAHDVLGVQEDPSDDPDDLIDQLEQGVLDMGIRISDQQNAIASLSMDVVALSIQNSRLMGDLKLSLKVMEALAREVNDGASFGKALSVIRREGDPEIVNRMTTENGIEVDVTLTFTEDKLREALKLAIAEYITQTAASILQP